MKRSTAGRGSIRGSMSMLAAGPDTKLSGVMWGVLSSVGAWHTLGRGGNWGSRHRATELCDGLCRDEWGVIISWSDGQMDTLGNIRLLTDTDLREGEDGNGAWQGWQCYPNWQSPTHPQSLPCISCHLGRSVWGAGGESLGTCCLCPAFLQGVQESRYHYHCCLWHDAGMKTQGLMGFWQSSIHSHPPLNVHLLSLAPPGRHQDNPFGNPGLGLASVW